LHRWAEHTSELELTIEADAEADVFVEGALALADLLADEPRGEPRRREIELSASDRATLLADWLAELVFLAETDGFRPERVALELRDGALRASVEGRTGTPRHLVKAVTYHRLELARAGDRWRARLVLDV
jgi:SHS2 domain-containing protein